MCAVRPYLNTHGLSASIGPLKPRVAASASAPWTPPALVKVTRVELGTLGAVLSTLEERTGELVTPADLLGVVTVPGPDQEARVWLNRNASHLGEFGPHDWGDADPCAPGEPVRVGPDGNLLIGGG